jgi:hypothetical protein
MKGFIHWLLGLWYHRLRRIDLEILWPECKAQADNLDLAKATFATHAFHDPAWLYLGEDQIYHIIDRLT